MKWKGTAVVVAGVTWIVAEMGPAQTKGLLATPEQQKVPVMAGAFSRDSRMLAPGPTNVFGDPLPAGAIARLGTSGRDKRVQEGQVLALAFSPDGFELLTAAADNTAWLWDVASHRVVRQFEHDGRAKYPPGTDLVVASLHGLRAMRADRVGAMMQRCIARSVQRGFLRLSRHLTLVFFASPSSAAEGAYSAETSADRVGWRSLQCKQGAPTTRCV
jgi:hypothetical protein